MKLGLRLTALLVVGITLVTFLVARSQVRSEKQGMRDDLQRRAEVLAESLQEIIEPILEKNETNQLRRVVERFQNREHLDGVGIYGPQGQLVAESSSLGATFQAPQMSIATARLQDRGFGELRTLGGNSTHIYYQPLHHTIDANGKPLQHATDVIGVLTIYHDAGYIEAQTEQVWRETLWHVVIQVLLIVLITVALLRWAIFLPLTRTEQWIRELRSGRGAPRSPLPTEELFQPLSREVAKLAQSLTEARASAEEEARLRETGESLWTAERLRISMQTKLRGRPLFVVSNREPYEHVRRGKTIETMVPASGLVTALEPILRACGGTWIANASGDADRDVVDKHDRVRVPPEQPEYTLRRIWIDEEAYDGYYLGFANEGLWPLCHIAHTRPIFRISDWEHYSEVNSQFCDAVLKEMEGAVEPIVLIQDYHFALLPRLIKQKRPDARVAIFWHIPWPNPEAFHICPWQKELLDGLLGADLVSFHIQAHCNNFLETIDRALESRIDWDRFSVNRGDQTTLVRPHPISVAWPERHGRPPARVTPEERTAILQSLDVEASFVGFGVDRLDYTKGIMERFRGIESFLQKNPSMREQFTFIQVGAPSRTRIPRYQEFLNEVDREAERINEEYQTKRWKPIVFLKKHHSHKEIEPLYRAADLCMVTSLHDGMNLVAKEFIAAREDEDGVLILSQFAGAARELRDALVVNPYDSEQLASAIKFALAMPPEERQARMQRMRRSVREHNVYRWAAELISELCDIRLEQPDAVLER